MRYLFIIALALLLASCSDNPAEPEPEPSPISFLEVPNPPMEDDTSYVNIDELVDFGNANKQSLNLVGSHPSLDAQIISEPYDYALIPKPDLNGRMYVELEARNDEGVEKRDRIYFEVAPRSDLELQLINGFTGEASKGFVAFDGDSIVSENGYFSVLIQDPTVTSFRTGLLRDDMPDSYIRTTHIQEGEDFSGDLHHVHFGLYDAQRNLVARLSQDGYDKDGPMDVERMKGAAAELHFHYRGHNGLLHRWNGSENGMNPNKIVIAKNVSYLDEDGRTESFGEDYEEVVTRFSEQIDLMNEVLAHPVPVETVDEFSYSGRESVEDFMLVGPDSKLREIGALGMIRHMSEHPDRIYGARVKIRTPKPLSVSGQRTYFVWLPQHEIGSIIHNSSSRPIEHVNFEESVLSGGSYNIDYLEDRLPVLDTTMGLLLNNSNYETGMQFHDLFGLPEGFNEVNYDFRDTN